MAESSLSNSSPLNPPSRFICHVCQKQFSQYTCPRCNTRYCSLHCYKSHSARCTESFMRDNVLSELKTVQVDDGTKRKTLEMLKRVYAEELEDSPDDGCFSISDETVKRVLSGDSFSFDDLTVEEKREFERAVTSGHLSKMIEPWEPWWLKPAAKEITLTKEGTRLIQPVSNDSKDDGASDVPMGPDSSLPLLNTLVSTQPSPLLSLHLADILYSYCFALRIYNGDWLSDAGGAAMVILSVSSVLGQGDKPETMMEVLSFNLEQIRSTEFKHMCGLDFGLRIVDDVVSLLDLGRPALVCALCDLNTMMERSERDLKAEKPKSARNSELRNKIKLGGKKIFFLMCWVNEQPQDVFSSSGAHLESEKASIANHHRRRFEENREAKKKLTIEELV